MNTILTDSDIDAVYAGCHDDYGYPILDERPFAYERAIEAAVLTKLRDQGAFAYEVHFPDQQRGELVYDLDELCEDMTNDESHKVTPLYSISLLAVAQPKDQA